MSAPLGRFAVYFDLETGGTNDTHPDIQLAAVAIDEASWAQISSFEAKIAFDPATADPAALALNHYTPEGWVGAESLVLVCARFASFLERFRSIEMISKRGHPYSVAKLVGHNAASFDGPRLRRMFERCELFLPADPRVRCTCQRAMWWCDERGIVPKDFKLSTLCQQFGIPVETSHDALADVRLTVALSKALAIGARNGVAA
jgi:DNA polymerase III alpha subunit (gram-positive type)